MNIPARVTQASDKDFKAKVFDDKTDTSVGGWRTNVKVTILLQPGGEGARLAGLSNDDIAKTEVWGGGFGEFQDKVFKYLKSLRVGDEIEIVKLDRARDYSPVIPEEFQYDPAPYNPDAPARGAVQRSEPVYVNEESQAPPSRPPELDSGPSYRGGFRQLSPKQRLMALLELEDARWFWMNCYRTVNEMLHPNDGISPDQRAAMATTFFLNSPPYRLKSNGFDPADFGEREPRLPGDVYRWLHQSDESDSRTPITEAQLKTMNSALGKLMSDKERKAFLKRMFNVDSSADMTLHQASQVIDWTGANEKNGWRPTLSAQVEAGLIREVLEVE